jgi:tetratricopeptide (TPR) repeat protein
MIATMCLACSGSGYEVVRVHSGRAHVGRFVSSTAYAASLDASIAEERGEWARAVELLRRARDEDPDGPELGARLGIALCHLGKVQAGMFAIEDALRIDPDLERGYTARARCRLLIGKTKQDTDAARADLIRALSIDADALEPALLLVELDLRANDLSRARARAEETAVLHPRSARALRAVAEVSAREGDSKRAMSAAVAATALDDATGAIARSIALPAADRSGVVAYALALRNSASPSKADAVVGTCVAQLKAFEAIASRAEPDAVVAAADATRSVCPDLDAEITRIEVVATWTPKNADAVEARALSATSAEARRFGARMRLRRLALSELLDANALPRAEDRPTLAIHLAAAAVRKPDDGLARVAHDLAPSEPTVARLVSEALRRAGKSDDPLRKHACALARTTLEKQECPVAGAPG